MATPTFLLSQTYNQSDRLPEIGHALVNAGRLAPGLVVDYDVRDQARVEAAARNAAPLAPLIADPGGLRFGRRFIGGGRSRAASWIRRAEPSSRADWNQMTTETIDAQRALNPAYLVTPGVEIHAGQILQLQRAVAAARVAYGARLRNDPPWLARICVHDEWLHDSRQSTNLLDELSDLPDSFGVALHVRWSRRGVLIDQASLEALRTVVTTLSEDGRDVILLRSGLVGWLATAWGASGFSAGLPRSSWIDEGRVPGGRARGSRNKEWFFERSILHWVERADHNRLSAASGYASCRCAFCKQLAHSASWTPAAPQHALFGLARIAQRVQGATVTDRRVAVRSILQRAQRNWEMVGAGQVFRTRGQAAPHLALWISLA